MGNLNREHRTTFVFSTHDPRIVERAQRIIRRLDGGIEADELQSASEG
jgi:putative ABC transport system ATP-binding protein